MLKIPQAKLQNYRNWELPDVQVEFRKSRGIRNQIANLHWIIEKAREFQKNIYFIDYTKASDCVDHNKLWKVLRDENTRPPYLSLEKPACGSRATLEQNMKQQTGSKSGKEYDKAVYCQPVLLTSLQYTSCEMLGWMNHKLESTLPGEISTTSDMQMTPH